jgi:hypothetical protein
MDVPTGIWRAERALATAGIHTHGEKLVELATSIIDAVDTAGADANDDQLAAIIDAHIGPDSICCLGCLFALAAESPELIFEPAPATMDAECLIEALAQTVWSAAIALARNQRTLLAEIENTRQKLLAATADTHPDGGTSHGS